MSKQTPEARRNQAAQKLYNFIAEHPTDTATNPQEVLYYLAVLREITLLHSDGDIIDTENSEFNRGYAAGIRAARLNVYTETFSDYCTDPGLYDAIEAALTEFMDTYEPTTDRQTIQRQTRDIYDGIMETVPLADPRTHLPIMHTRATMTARFGMMNDKVNRTMLNGVANVRDLDGQLKYIWHIDTAGRGQERTAIVASATYRGQKTLTNRKTTANDNAVLTAVCNKIMDAQLAGIEPPYYFTEDELWRRLHGITDTHRRPTDAQRRAFNDSIYKMRFTEDYVDFTGELKRHDVLLDDLAGYGYERLTEGKFEGYRLPAERVTFTTEKGRTVSGYEFWKIPFLYAYNMAINHVVLVDSELLDVSDTIRDEENVTAFKLYLLQEIQRMYYPKSSKRHRDNNRILYDTIYRELDIPTPAERKDRAKFKSDASYAGAVKNEAKLDRDKIDALLLSFQNKKFIKDWDHVRKGHSYVGVDIDLNPDRYLTPAELTDEKQNQ